MLHQRLAPRDGVGIAVDAQHGAIGGFQDGAGIAAAVGLGLQLWLPGIALWIVGHSLAVWGARLDPQFMQVFARHIKYPMLFDV